MFTNIFDIISTFTVELKVYIVLFYQYNNNKMAACVNMKSDMLSFQKKMRDSARRLAFTMQFSRAQRTHDMDITVNQKNQFKGMI